MHPKFIQIHTLTTYPTSLLNRSDNGRAKTKYYGNALRTRISSQCRKYHARMTPGSFSIPEIAKALDLEESVRSRWSFEMQVLQPVLVELPENQAAKARTLALGIRDLVTGKNDKKKPEKTSSDPEDLRLDQLVVLGAPEIRYMRETLRSLCQEIPDEEKAKEVCKGKSVLAKALKDVKKLVGAKAVGLDAALNGRMMTGDVLAQVDSCVKWSHALTVHEHTCEIDYFSAVDDLQLSGVREESGFAHGGYADLTTGTFYACVVIDVDGLHQNLGSVPSEVFHKMLPTILNGLVWNVATVCPGAKTGSTAPYQYADFVHVEMGDHQPRQLVRAWQRAVPRTGDVLEATYDQLFEFLEAEKSMYGSLWRGFYATTGPEHKILGSRTNMKSLVELALTEGL